MDKVDLMEGGFDEPIETLNALVAARGLFSNKWVSDAETWTRLA